MTGLLSAETRLLPEVDLTIEELNELWSHLADENGWKAHQAAWKLAAGGQKAVKFLADMVPPAVKPSKEKLAGLRKQLQGEDLDGRDLAARKLVDLGIVLTPDEVGLLRRIDPRRIPANARNFEDAIAKGYDRESFLKPAPTLLGLPDRNRESRAIAALERCKNPAAQTLLETLAKGYDKSPLTKEAASALQRVQKRK